MRCEICIRARSYRAAVNNARFRPHPSALVLMGTTLCTCKQDGTNAHARMHTRLHNELEGRIVFEGGLIRPATRCETRDPLGGDAVHPA